MAAELLICTESNLNLLGYQKGDIVNVSPGGTYPDGEVWSNQRLCLLKVTDATVSEMEDIFIPEWRRTIGFSPTWIPAQKGFEVVLSCTNLSILENDVDYGKISKEKAENYLTLWGCAIDSFSSNSVTFTATVFNVFKSEGFLEKNPINVQFTEDSWDSENNIMRITIDISNKPWEVNAVLPILIEKGCTHISDTIDTITVDVPRGVLSAAFKDDLQSKLAKLVMRRVNYVSNGAVNNIVSAGRVASTDKATLATYTRNRLTES